MYLLVGESVDGLVPSPSATSTIKYLAQPWQCSVVHLEHAVDSSLLIGSGKSQTLMWEYKIFSATSVCFLFFFSSLLRRYAA